MRILILTLMTPLILGCAPNLSKPPITANPNHETRPPKPEPEARPPKPKPETRTPKPAPHPEPDTRNPITTLTSP